MISQRYLRVLGKIYERIRESSINWAVTGSLSFALQGVPVDPNDIDIQTDKAGAYEIQRRLSEFVVKKVAFSPNSRIRSYLGVLEIGEIRVEIMGDLEKRLEDGTWEALLNLKSLRRFEEVEGMRIPVLPLEYEYQAYLKMGRVEKAEVLRRWLSSQTSKRRPQPYHEG